MQSTLSFLAATFGEPVAASVLASLSETDRRAVQAIGATEELPYALLVRLWEHADRVLQRVTEGQGAGHVAQWAEQTGEASIGSYGVQLYGGILRKPTPLEFLTQSISLFRLYYQPGDMAVVESAPGRAVLRLVGFDPQTRIFCRRMTGGLRQAITLAGGGASRVRHVRCVLEGDAFCEWELHWQVEGSAIDHGTAGARRTT